MYNKAFFGLYENLFLVLKEEFGEEKALELFTKIMRFGLKKAYDATGFQKGSPKDFAKVVGARDKSVGLKVSFPEIQKEKIVYRFLTDPFPGLKGKVDFAKLDATYMQFKAEYLLGSDWKYETTRHFWNGSKFTEHVISKKN
ncbi:MAG TPA: hypothetical protein VI977_06535 [archaeon]|nr:hypothetical protein [archaeon]